MKQNDNEPRTQYLTKTHETINVRENRKAQPSMDNPDVQATLRTQNNKYNTDN